MRRSSYFGNALSTVLAGAILIAASGCSNTTAAPETKAQAGIGNWNVIEDRGVLLLQIKIPQSASHCPGIPAQYRARCYIGNQWVFDGSHIGMHYGVNTAHHVHFQVVRDAGTFTLDGAVFSKTAGKVARGAVLDFIPNTGFVRAFPQFKGETLKLALFDINRHTLDTALSSDPRITVDGVIRNVSLRRMAALERRIGGDPTTFAH